MTVVETNVGQRLVYADPPCSLPEAAKMLVRATVQQEKSTQKSAHETLRQLSLQQNKELDSEYVHFIQNVLCRLAPDQEPQLRWVSSAPVNEQIDLLWDSVEEFFRAYQQKDTFQKFKELLQKFSDIGIRALNQPMCHLFCRFFLQPPASFVCQYAQSSEVEPFLREVFKRFFVDQDTQFWLDSIFHENAWPQAALSLQSFLLTRAAPLPITSFFELFNRLFAQTSDPNVLFALVERGFRNSDSHECREIVRDVLAKKMGIFQGVLTQSVRALQLILLFLQLPTSWHNLKNAEIVAQAWAMTTCSCSLLALYKKGEWVGRSVLVDPLSYDHHFSYFVLSKRKVELLQASGNFKRVTSAIECTFSAQGIPSGQLVAQSVNLYKDLSTNEFLTNYAIEQNALLAFSEKKYALLLRGLPGVVQLKSSFYYCKQVTPERSVPIVSLIWEYYDMDLQRAMHQNKIEGLSDKRQIAEDLLVGLSSIHGKGLFHWDIKAENVLCRKEGDQLRACWCDYGLMFHIDEALDRIQQRHNGSFYGSVGYTPPENFTLGEYTTQYGLLEKLKKVEIWALGQLLFELYHSQGGIVVEIPWRAAMTQIATNAPKEDLIALKPLFYNAIVDAYLELEETEDPFLGLIYSMLNPDPEQRPSIDRCLEVIRYQAIPWTTPA